MKTNVKQKKVIKNKEKIAFGFKFKEQYKYKFWKQKHNSVTKHTLVTSPFLNPILKARTLFFLIGICSLSNKS